MKCRHCGSDLRLTLIDLGQSPPSNAYLTFEGLSKPESVYPLRVLVCETCWLVQTEDFVRREELFASDYAYFSGYSASWLRHVERYVDNVVQRFQLQPQSYVIEVAANDGHLLQYMRQRGIGCLGIEPTHSTATAAQARGIPIVEAFFGAALGADLAAKRRADLMVANNVLAHVPDINDFVSGFASLLQPDGVATFEFPHLLKMIEGKQWDTIYHEHFSYLSLTAVTRVFSVNGLSIFDVEEIPTHGGSLRVFAQRADSGERQTGKAVREMEDYELRNGVAVPATYGGFQESAEQARDELMGFLTEASDRGQLVAAYGAAAKGNTLFNFCGVTPGLVKFVVDANPAKQGRFLPGSHIPVFPEARLSEERPDFVLILPWNLAGEIAETARYVTDWGGRFVTAIPSLQVLP
jgi:SAM-dependent methyltransferase